MSSILLYVLSRMKIGISKEAIIQKYDLEEYLTKNQPHWTSAFPGSQDRGDKQRLITMFT